MLTDIFSPTIRRYRVPLAVWFLHICAAAALLSFGILSFFLRGDHPPQGSVSAYFLEIDMFKILSFVSRFDLRFVCLAPALIGLMMVFFGCAYEASAQLHLLKSQGAEALAAYQAHVALAQLSVFGVIWTGVTNSSVTMSGVVQGYGQALVFFVTPLCVGFTLVARLLVRVNRAFLFGRLD